MDNSTDLRVDLTGQDVKRQVMEYREACEQKYRASRSSYDEGYVDALDYVRDVLAPCVVLTAEEAVEVRHVLLTVASDHPGFQGSYTAERIYALLTPDEVIPGYGSSIEQTDEEFIAEQTGGPC
jgi:hypothetical protein